MQSNAIKKWSTIRGLPVTIPTQGRTVGTISDFFFKPGTDSVDALLVHIPLQGMRALPSSGITTIEKDKVTIANEEMLLSALPPLSSGNALTSYKVQGESGMQVGFVNEVWLGIALPAALHIAALEIVKERGQSNAQSKRLSGDDILHYKQDCIIIDDQDARRLR